MNNDKKYANYQKTKRKRILIIILSILVIILEALALLELISFIWGVILFLIIKFFFKKNN